MEQNPPNEKSAIAGNQAAGAAARDTLMGNLKNVIDDAEKWLDNAAAHESETSSDIRARFDDTLRTAKDDLRKLEDTILAQGQNAAEAAHVYVRDNPWKAVGLGAAAGVILGLLIARK